MSPPIMEPNLCPISSVALGLHCTWGLHFTSIYHPKGNGQTEQKNQTLEQYLRVYFNYQQDNWSKLLPSADFTYNNTLSATTGIKPFFSNTGYHLNFTVHPSATFHLHAYIIFPQTSTSYTSSSGSTLPKLNINTKPLLIPDDLWVQNSGLEGHAFVKAQFFCMTWPSRNFPTNSSGHMKSLHDLTTTQSPCNFWTSMLYTQFSMSPCWNQNSWAGSPNKFSLCLHPSLSMTNPNSKSLRFLTPRSITDTKPASSSTLLMDRIWRHWQRNLLDTCIWTWKCFRNSLWLHSAYPAKPGLLSQL